MGGNEAMQPAWRTIVNPPTGQVPNRCSISGRLLELISISFACRRVKALRKKHGEKDSLVV